MLTQKAKSIERLNNDELSVIADFLTLEEVRTLSHTSSGFFYNKDFWKTLLQKKYKFTQKIFLYFETYFNYSDWRGLYIKLGKQIEKFPLEIQKLFKNLAYPQILIAFNLNSLLIEELKNTNSELFTPIMDANGLTFLHTILLSGHLKAMQLISQNPYFIPLLTQKKIVLLIDNEARSYCVDTLGIISGNATYIANYIEQHEIPPIKKYPEKRHYDWILLVALFGSLDNIKSLIKKLNTYNFQHDPYHQENTEALNVNLSEEFIDSIHRYTIENFNVSDDIPRFYYCLSLNKSPSVLKFLLSTKKFKEYIFFDYFFYTLYENEENDEKRDSTKICRGLFTILHNQLSLSTLQYLIKDYKILDEIQNRVVANFTKCFLYNSLLLEGGAPFVQWLQRDEKDAFEKIFASYRLLVNDLNDEKYPIDVDAIILSYINLLSKTDFSLIDTYVHNRSRPERNIYYVLIYYALDCFLQSSRYDQVKCFLQHCYKIDDFKEDLSKKIFQSDNAMLVQLGFDMHMQLPFFQSLEISQYSPETVKIFLQYLPNNESGHKILFDIFEFYNENYHTLRYTLYPLLPELYQLILKSEKFNLIQKFIATNKLSTPFSFLIETIPPVFLLPLLLRNQSVYKDLIASLQKYYLYNCEIFMYGHPEGNHHQNLLYAHCLAYFLMAHLTKNKFNVHSYGKIIDVVQSIFLTMIKVEGISYRIPQTNEFDNTVQTIIYFLFDKYRFDEVILDYFDKFTFSAQTLVLTLNYWINQNRVDPYRNLAICKSLLEKQNAEKYKTSIIVLFEKTIQLIPDELKDDAMRKTIRELAEILLIQQEPLLKKVKLNEKF